MSDYIECIYYIISLMYIFCIFVDIYFRTAPNIIIEMR